MTQDEIIEKLRSPEWEKLSVFELDSVAEWILLARSLRGKDKSTMLIARIQCLLVDAGKITDQGFVDLLNADIGG